MLSRRAGFTCCALFLAAGAAGAIAPAEILRVKLEDPTTDPAVAHVRMALERTTLTAGRVTFEAVNGSKTLKHDVVVVHERGTGEPPIDPQHDGLNEHAVRRLGQITDIAPGKTGKLTLNLGPGTYLLLCGEAGHYKDGTVAKLVVAP